MEERNKIDLKEGNYWNNLETKNILFLENILLNNNKVLIKKNKEISFWKIISFILFIIIILIVVVYFFDTFHYNYSNCSCLFL